MHRIWITWEKHRRTIQLASSLPGIKLFQIELEAHRIVRYPRLLLNTAAILIREKPALVIVQNPSVVLSFFLVALSKMSTFKVVVDAHNEGLMPFYPKYNWLLPMYNIIQKWATLTIVTNARLAVRVSSKGGTPFILEDKIPHFNSCNRISLKGRQNAIFVCTFEKDEPYFELIQAASMIDPSVFLYVTGKYEKAPILIIEQAPTNVVFTGLLSDQHYIDLLFSCDVVIDLTLMQDCLVCGAYEAIALGKPIILSDTQALKNYFSKGTVFTENTPEAIAEAIAYALANKKRLSGESALLRAELELSWNKKIFNLYTLLDELEYKRI